MSNLSQFLGGKIKKSQVITATGTFSPSSTLIASGGWVDAFVVGGGAGGINYSDGAGSQTYWGGGGGAVCTSTIQLSTTQTINVTIGAGGAVNTASSAQNNGGFTSIHWTSAVTGTVATTGGTTLTASAVNSIASKSFILIDSEIMYVSAGGGTTSLTVTRGALGSVAATHSAAVIYVIGATSGGGQGPHSGIDYLSGVSYSGKQFVLATSDGSNSYSAYFGGGAGGPAAPPTYNTTSQLYTQFFSNTTYSYPYYMIPGGPGPGISGFGAGGTGSGGFSPSSIMNTAIVSTTSANSGAGGSYTVAGKSGIVILTWFE